MRRPLCAHCGHPSALARHAKGLLKFPVYGRIIKSDHKNAVIERFYDDCRLLSFAANDPLFWVQRSICTMNDKQFDISFRFIETAYGLARRCTHWDNYQIENHKARVLLIQSRETGVSADGSREREAISLLQSVLAKKNDDLYHPLSVMRIYAEIVDRYSNTLIPGQKVPLRQSLETAIRSISNFIHPGRFKNLADLQSRLAGAVKALR